MLPLRRVASLASRRSTAAPARRAAASAVPRPPSLAGVPADARDDVIRALEIADRAAATWTLQATPFLKPPAVATALAALAPLAGLAGVPWGGYAGAERCRLIVGREEDLASSPDVADPAVGGVAAVAVAGTFAFDAATHRDFLGAVLNTGLDRRVVGDILVAADAGATIFSTPDAAAHIAASLDRVRTVRVRCAVVALESVALPAVKPATTVRTVEASTRLDAVAAAAFRMPRAKVADGVRRGDVRLNWREAKPSAAVAAGDVISVAGKGRAEVVAVEETKKGRWAIEAVRLA